MADVEETKKVSTLANKTDDGKMDMRAFFRDTERGVRGFLAYWDSRAKGNQALYPYRMPSDQWWREFIKWSSKSETR